MTSWAEIARLVETRADGRCEYCRMHESLQGATFHIEHIIPTSKGGSSEPENLAWACPRCNLCKSDRVEAVDPESGVTIALFNPRTEQWAYHFQWEGHRVVGRTAVGRATAEALDLNHHRRLFIRRAEELLDLFPPDEGL